MSRSIQLVVLVLGVLLGYGIGVLFGDASGVEPAPTPDPGPRSDVRITTTTATRATTTTTTELQGDSPTTATYLLWSTGGLPQDLVDALTSQFDQISIVKGDTVELTSKGGAVIPLDALAIDRHAHQLFDPEDTLANLEPGTVILGATSARLRAASPGDVLTIAGIDYSVAAIAPDEAVSAAEVVFDKNDENPVVTDRFALIATDFARTDFEQTVRNLYHGPAPLRIRAEGETPWLRHGDAVLPQVFIKEALGEFSYSNLSGSEFTQDEAFLDEHIVREEVPILGEVICHRRVVEMLDGAMSQLVEEGLSHLVDPAGYAGCWNPRFIRPVTGTTSGVSRHSWGAAVDINTRTNPVGSAGTQDPRLVEIMLEWGFAWGGDWLIPDPMHFEYGIPPG